MFCRTLHDKRTAPVGIQPQMDSEISPEAVVKDVTKSRLALTLMRSFPRNACVFDRTDKQSSVEVIKRHSMKRDRTLHNNGMKAVLSRPSGQNPPRP